MGPWSSTTSWRSIKVNDDFSLNLATEAGDILLSKADLITLLTNEGVAGALVDDLTPIPVPVRP